MPTKELAERLSTVLLTTTKVTGMTIHLFC